MSRASNILEKTKIEETFQIIGNLDASEIVVSFEDKLQSLGFKDIIVEVYLDDNGGTFVKFTDSAGDSVLVLFRFDENGDALASVVSEDDEQITIDLSPMNPPSIELSDESEFVDLIDLSWMNKTTVQLLLNAGMVGSDNQKNITTASKQAVIGNRKMKLPIIMKKDQMNKTDQLNLQKAKSNGLM